MDERGSTIGQAFGDLAGDPVDPPDTVPGATTTLSAGLPSVPSAEGKEPIMNQDDSSEEAPAASLVGSLADFSLSDILSMLASTKQTGELQVVSEAVDGKVWLADGELSNAHVGAATTIGQAVFELACVSEGWFYFTVGVVSSSGQPTVPVLAVLNEVRPQVDEWKEIRRDVPLDAVVTLAPEPPGQDVQIRSDQWRLLTTVGTSGLSVKEVLDQLGGDQVAGLRTLRDLLAAGLIELDPGPSGRRGSDLGSTFPSPADGGAEISTLPSPPDLNHTDPGDDERLNSPPPPPDRATTVADGGRDGLAQVAIMPPPIADDPWTPSAEPSSADDNGVA
jgi:hypothetical protein